MLHTRFMVKLLVRLGLFLPEPNKSYQRLHLSIPRANLDTSDMFETGFEGKEVALLCGGDAEDSASSAGVK